MPGARLGAFFGHKNKEGTKTAPSNLGKGGINNNNKTHTHARSVIRVPGSTVSSLVVDRDQVGLEVVALVDLRRVVAQLA